MGLEAGQLLAGKYRLLQLLGEGGMGCVWAAEDTQLGREVAVKVLSSGAREAVAQKRFMREARTAAQLHSPNVAQVFDFGVHLAHPFIVMERLHGEDLEQRGARGRLDSGAVAALMRGAGAALTEAHDNDIIHRDIKPANLFFAQVAGQEVVKVLDFGIAARGRDSGRLTAEGSIIGTPLYMSPEQSQGQPVDRRSDLWSLAVVAYEALTGEHPFVAGTDWESLAAIAKRPVKPPTTIVDGLPPTLDDFFQKALRRAPAERFQSADHLARAFSAAARGEALLAEGGATLPMAPLHTTENQALHKPRVDTDIVAVKGGRATTTVGRGSALALSALVLVAVFTWRGMSPDVHAPLRASAGLVPAEGYRIELGDSAGGTHGATSGRAPVTDGSSAAQTPPPSRASGQPPASVGRKPSAGARPSPPPQPKSPQPKSSQPAALPLPKAPRTTAPSGSEANEFGI